jgi:hypothetical protein
MEPSAARLFDVVAYSPETHGAFVRSTWAWGALRNRSGEARARLDAYLAEEGSRALLAHLRGSPDTFAGWAARTADALVFAFVLPVMRRRGLGTLMVHRLGFGDAPVPLLHWTPNAQRVAAHSGRVFYALFPLVAHRHERTT